MKIDPLAWALVALASGCGGQEATGPTTISAQRTWSPIGRTARTGLSTAERFGYGGTAPARPGSSGSGGQHTGDLVWSTPPGWREFPPTSMRQANFMVAGDARAECYLTVLEGDGGGLLANVNRWRGQMSLEPTDASSLAGAPRASLLGAQALVVDFGGTWSGMSGDAASTDFRLIGMLSVDSAQAHFLKMVGPAEVVADQKLAFLALAASFREDHSSHDHGSPQPTSRQQSALSWKAPEGWRETGSRAMREVTFEIGDGLTAECYVALLGGNAGGAFANINRWREQMGQAALSSAEFDELERISMLGTEAVVVEVQGTFTGMNAKQVPEASLLGAVCQLPQAAVFVKLVGPEDLVNSSRSDFITFCQSLGQGG